MLHFDNLIECAELRLRPIRKSLHAWRWSSAGVLIRVTFKAPPSHPSPSGCCVQIREVLDLHALLETLLSESEPVQKLRLSLLHQILPVFPIGHIHDRSLKASEVALSTCDHGQHLRVWL